MFAPFSGAEEPIARHAGRGHEVLLFLLILRDEPMHTYLRDSPACLLVTAARRPLSLLRPYVACDLHPEGEALFWWSTLSWHLRYLRTIPSKLAVIASTMALFATLFAVRHTQYRPTTTTLYRYAVSPSLRTQPIPT